MSPINPRTSTSDPLRVHPLEITGVPGRLGLTFCPGKTDPHAATGSWARCLDSDLQAIRQWGASALVTLVEPHELDLLGVPDLGATSSRYGLDWFHLPIVDNGVPDASFEQAWTERHGPEFRQRLVSGRHLVLHCRVGLGRTGTIAARLLVELGSAPADAIARVRAARPGAIENRAQEQYVLGLTV